MITEQTLIDIAEKIDYEVNKAQKKLRELSKREKESGVKFDLRLAVETEIDTLKMARQFVTVAINGNKEKETI